MANGFNKAECIECKRKTWHYIMRCTEHSLYDPKVIHRPIDHIMGARVVQLPTEQEIRRANRMDMSMWNVGQERKKAQVDISNEAWAADLFADAPSIPALEPGQMLCTFCGKVIDSTNSLSEKRSKIRIMLQMHEGPDGPEMREKVTSNVVEVHACKDHVLQIRKPITVRVV